MFEQPRPSRDAGEEPPCEAHRRLPKLKPAQGDLISGGRNPEQRSKKEEDKHCGNYYCMQSALISLYFMEIFLSQIF